MPLLDFVLPLYVDEYVSLGQAGEIVVQDDRGSRVRLVLQERPKEENE